MSEIEAKNMNGNPRIKSGHCLQSCLHNKVFASFYTCFSFSLVPVVSESAFASAIVKLILFLICFALKSDCQPPVLLRLRAPSADATLVSLFLIVALPE